MGGNRNSYNTSAGKPEGRGPFEDLDVGVKKILNGFLKEQNARM
jgi:hypothetical protein